MRKYFWSLAVLALALGLARPSSAEITGLVTAAVPQQFKAGMATLPAGEYTVEEADVRASTLIVRNTATGKADMVSYVTRLAPKSADEAALVFDQVGKDLTLSEVYIGGDVDGYLVSTTPAKHTHVVVKATRKRG